MAAVAAMQLGQPLGPFRDCLPRCSDTSIRISFPQWVPTEVMKEAEALSIAEAEQVLSALLAAEATVDAACGTFISQKTLASARLIGHTCIRRGIPAGRDRRA